MHVQTGPAPGQRMGNWLAWTGVAELINIVILSAFVWTFTRGRAGPWPFTILGLLLVNLILFEGGIYWLIKFGRGRRPSPAHPRPAHFQPGLIRALYAANGLALASFPVAVLLTAILEPAAVRSLDLFAGLALFLFACGEFVHYFLFKINMRPREWRAARARGRPVRARFWRELRRAEDTATSSDRMSGRSTPAGRT
jgi:hypothetical protein